MTDSSLSKRNAEVKEHSALFVVADADQFLPAPGSWAFKIGTRVVVCAGLLVIASCFLPYEQTVRAKGVVRPVGDNTLLRSEQPGRIARVFIRPNQIVSANQVLAVMDKKHLSGRRRQLENELRQVASQRQETLAQQKQLDVELASNQILNKAQVDVSQADVSKADASLAYATAEMKRYNELAKVGGVPRLLGHQKYASYLIADSALKQARFGVAQQRAKLAAERARLVQESKVLHRQLADQVRQSLALSTELEDVKRALVHAEVRSPVEATVVRTSLNHVGQIVNAGDVIAELAPRNAPLLSKVLVSSRDVGSIEPGQRAYLRVSACPYSRFGLLRGVVKHVSADTASVPPSSGAGGPFYEVAIKPDHRELRGSGERCSLRIGMDVQADVMTKRHSIMSFLVSKLRLNIAG